MKWPQPTRKDHYAFCQIEQWRETRDARGRTGTHHVTFELEHPDGRTLRTRVSHPVDRSDYGPHVWRHILRDQLEVDDAVFWACVQDGVRPQRGGPDPARQDSLPAELVYLLITRVGLAETEVSAMSKDEAVARMQQFWSQGDR